MYYCVEDGLEVLKVRDAVVGDQKAEQLAERLEVVDERLGNKLVIRQVGE